MTGPGVSSFSSHSAAAGRTTPAAKPCTQSRRSRWSSESSSENGTSEASGAAYAARAASVALASMSPHPGRRGLFLARLAAVGKARQAPTECAEEAEPDQQHEDVRGAGEEAGHVLLLLALEVLLVAHERAGEVGLGRDLGHWHGRVLGQEDRHARHRAALLQA